MVSACRRRRGVSSLSSRWRESGTRQRMDLLAMVTSAKFFVYRADTSRARPTSFRWRRAKSCQRFRPGDFVPKRTLARLPGARKTDALMAIPGPSLDVYAFYRSTTQRICTGFQFRESTVVSSDLESIVIS